MRTFARVSCIVGTIGVVVSAVVPAYAKGSELHRVVIQGPALSQSLSLSRQQFGVPDSENHAAAIALEGLMGRYPKSDRKPGGALGPRYQLRYEIDLLTGEVVSLRQYLYPYARVGPVTFTQRGQTVPFPAGYEHPGSAFKVKTGWLPFPGWLLHRLQRYGLPPKSMARQAGESEVCATGPASSNAGWAVAAAALAALAAFVLLSKRPVPTSLGLPGGGRTPPPSV